MNNTLLDLPDISPENSSAPTLIKLSSVPVLFSETVWASRCSIGYSCTKTRTLLHTYHNEGARSTPGSSVSLVLLED